MDADKRMADLINVTKRLIDVLEREHELLSDRRHSELSGLLDEKETIGRVYQARVMGLQENPEQLEGVNEDARAELKELAVKVDDLIRRNARMLEAAMFASKRIVDLVAEALRDTANAAGTYSKGGQSYRKTNKTRAATQFRLIKRFDVTSGRTPAQR